jgi:hypothetical protein
LAWWDPHTGERRPITAQSLVLNGQPITRLKLELPPIRSVFVVATPPSS